MANPNIPKKKKQKKQEAGPPAFRKLIAEKKYPEALKSLEELRSQDSSNPEVLANIGWVRWQLKRNKKAAEEYLTLALTFDSKNIEAIRYTADIAIETKDFEKARRYLEVLVRLQPNNKVAKGKLAQLPEAQADPKPNKGWF